MKLFNTIMRRLSRTNGKKLAVSAAVFLTLTGVGFTGVTAISNNKAFAADCTTNSIIKCGASSRAQFIADVKASPQLQKIYAHFGLTSADYSRFISSAQPGVARRATNDIVVNGRVVATQVWSIGRNKSAQGSSPMTVPISGAGTLYGNYNDQAFASDHATLPVDVLFDQTTGKMQFAVMTNTCGNPATGNRVAPTYQCKSLQPKSLGNNKWSFTTDASAGNGASVDKLVYNFGDGTPSVTTTNPATVVTHTFTKSATVSVSVYIHLPGSSLIVLTNCKHAIAFTPPPAAFACTLLTLTPGKVDDKGNQSYTLAAKATATNATIKTYNFTFGDGSATGTVKTSATSASLTHVYAPGSYSSHVSITVLTDTGKTETVSSTNCAKPVSVKKLTPVLTCVSLASTPGAIDSTTGNQAYSFKASASASNATITSYVFKIDGAAQAPVSTAATSATATHTFAPGSHAVSVTVNGKDVDGHAITAPASTKCAASFTVKTPECKPGVPVGSPQCKPSTLTCVSLTDTPGSVDSNGNQAFNFTAKATADNATITSYTFKYDSTVQPPMSTSATSATAAHTFAPGSHTATVTVSGKDAAGKSINAPASTKCSVSFTVKTPECKPGVPVGSPQCKPSTLVCTSLTDTPGTVDDKGSQAFTFNAKASASNATITNYVFTFDGSAQPPVTTSASTATATQTFAPGSHTASVTVNGTDVDGKLVSATSPTCNLPVTVQQLPKNPNISLVKTVDGVKREQVNVGQNFVYQLVIKNTGAIALTNAVVTDQPPAGVTLVSADLGAVSGNAWTYTIPSLAVGESVTVNITAKVDAYVAGDLVNTACVNAPEVNPTQPNENDVCDTATVTVTPPAQVLAATTVLPNTGAGSVIGLFAATAILGTIAHRLFIGRRLSRRS